MANRTNQPSTMFSFSTTSDYDLIQGLNAVDIQPSAEEIKIADTIFKAKNVAINMQNDIKEIVVIAVLFVIFSLPQTEETITRLLPSLKNFPYTITVIKILLVVIFFWLAKNFALSRV